MPEHAAATTAHARFREGDPAGALALLASITDDSGLLVLRAHCRARLGRDPRPDLALAERAGGLTPPLRERAARALSDAGLPVDALATLRQRGAEPPSTAATLHEADLLRQLGQSVEAFATLRRAAERDPSDSTLALRCASLALSAWAPELAAPPLEAALRLHPEDAELRDRIAEIAVALGRADAAGRVQDALDASPTEVATAVERLIALGLPDRGTACVGDAPTDDPRTLARRAHLRLLQGALTEARVDAASALAHDPGCVPALVVLGAVAVLRGEPDALALLDRAVAAPEPKERNPWLGRDTALAWRAEARWRAGDLHGAFSDARDALARASPYHLPAHLLTMLVTSPHTDAAPGDDALDDAERLALARSRMPPGERIWSSWGHHAYAGCHELLAQLGNDRTRFPTIRGTSGPIGLTWDPYPRHLTRGLQQSLRVRPPGEVLDAFRALQDRHPHDPTLHTYEGETLLWLGRYAEAHAAFERARERFDRTTWAWIGRGAAELMLDRPADALATFAEGVQRSQSEGPSLFVYRGEAAWKLGRLDDARRDLATAVRRHPRRVAAWVLLARLELADGRPARAHAVVEALVRGAPGLVSDLGGLDPKAEPDAWLSAVLDRMRGNRSSTVHTWVASDGDLRFLAWTPPTSGR